MIKLKFPAAHSQTGPPIQKNVSLSYLSLLTEAVSFLCVLFGSLLLFHQEHLFVALSQKRVEVPDLRHQA